VPAEVSTRPAIWGRLDRAAPIHSVAVLSQAPRASKAQLSSPSGSLRFSIFSQPLPLNPGQERSEGQKCWEQRRIPRLGDQANPPGGGVGGAVGVGEVVAGAVEVRPRCLSQEPASRCSRRPLRFTK